MNATHVHLSLIIEFGLLRNRVKRNGNIAKIYIFIQHSAVMMIK